MGRCVPTENIYMQHHLHTPQPVPDTVPSPPPDTIPLSDPDMVPPPLPITPEPVPPEIIEPPVPSEHKRIRELGAPPSPKAGGQDQPRESPGVAQNSVPTETATGDPAVDAVEEVRHNPVSKGSNYGFGTPAEGFGQRRQVLDKPKSP